MPAAGIVRGASTVVADLEQERVGSVVERDRGAGGAGVADCVRERFLDDPVGGEIACSVEAPALSVDDEGRLEPGLAGSGEEGVEVNRVETGGRLGRLRLVRLAQEVEDRAQLAQPLLACALEIG